MYDVQRRRSGASQLSIEESQEPDGGSAETSAEETEETE